MKKTKENKGITLIALVITIIVLLILAGVTIATLTGENGILTQSSNAREKNKIAQAEEEVNLAFQTLRIKEQTEKIEKDQKDDIVLGELKEAYSKQKPESSVNLSGTKFLVKHRGYDFEVDENYQVAYKGETFDAKEWDKKACDEDCFIWASKDKNAGEEYHTIVGYTDEIMNQQKLVIPSRCHIIRCDNWQYPDQGRDFARTFTTIELPGSITEIGNIAFMCFNISKIEIPNSVTTIGSEAFRDCAELTDIVMSENITDINPWAFDGTAWYNNQPDGVVYLGKIAYKYKGEMPGNCSIVIEEGTKVLANNLFSYNRNLINIEIPDSVTYIGASAFCYTNLSSIKMPNGITSIEGWTFGGCYNLENIEIPSGVTRIGEYAFYDCTGLTSIEIPDSVTSIGEYAFYNCYNLANISMANVATIGKNAFEGTAWYNNQTGLIYLGTILYGYSGYMPANTSIVVEPGTTEIAGGAFSWCSGLTNIEIPDSVTSIGSNAFEGCSNLSSIRIPNGVTTISNYIFANCTGLTNVEIPDTVTKIQYSAFYNCTSLESVQIPENVTIMEWGIFDNCRNLRNINIPNGVTKIEGNTFYNCTSLTNIEIPDSVKEIGYGAFSSCTSLSSINIPNGVTRLESSTFSNCTSLTSIEIPDSVVEIQYCVFENCTNLSNIKISDNITYVEDNAFNGTLWYDNQPDGIVYVGKVAYKYKGTMPENSNIVIKDGTKTIAKRLFDDKYNLRSVEIPDSLEGIGDYAFSDCTNLTSISISRNTKYIGFNAFEGCTNLSSIVIWKNVEEVRGRSFRGWVSAQTLNIEADQVPNGWAWDWNDGCEAQIIYAYGD